MLSVFPLRLIFKLYKPLNFYFIVSCIKCDWFENKLIELKFCKKQTENDKYEWFLLPLFS